MAQQTIPSLLVLDRYFRTNEVPIMSLIFFQVFALFVAVPPVIQVTHLFGVAWYWFRSLTWVQNIAGPPPKRREESKNPPLGLPDLVLQRRPQREDLHIDDD